MANLSLPTITSTTTTLNPLNTPFLPKASHFSSPNKQNHARCSANACKKVISCKTNNNNIQNPKNNDTPFILDRRNMLIGLGSVYSGTAINLGGGSANTLAAPVGPDVYSCTLTDAAWDGAVGSVGDRCCPPAFPPDIVEFDFKNYPSRKVKVRRPAHLAMQDKEWLADYKRAIGVMKSLPMSDPRNFMQQARVHCAYCDGAYPMFGGNRELRLEVHGNWVFASWHRWYLFFFERMLGKLINKPDFALPYWNFDHPDGMRMPEMYKDIDSPLYDPNRHRKHLNEVIDLSYNIPAAGQPEQENDVSDADQIQQNLLLMRKQMLYVSKPELFFGGAYRAGDPIVHPPGEDPKTAGALEISPHNNVHSWVGSDTVRGNQDMGSFWSSARDPIFYSLHSNVDRMWSIWTDRLPGQSRNDIDEADYLNAFFMFYDENANPVKVYIGDSFNTEKLGYTYEDQDLPWYTMKPPTPGARQATPSPTCDPKVTLPIELNSVIKTSLVRPRNNRTKEDKEKQVEVLVINFRLGKRHGFVKFDVYVNDDTDHKPNEKTRITTNYVGSYTSLTHGRGRPDGNSERGDLVVKRTGLKLALTQLLDDIGASQDDCIRVTVVPQPGSEGIVIEDIKIGFVA